MMIFERHARGFTLLEMLVVLLIAGMALALTSQALSQYKRAYERVSASTQGGREYRLAERWFRESISGLYPVGKPGETGTTPMPNTVASPEDALAFRGDAHGFSGLTLLPVLAGQGIPTFQKWTIAPNRFGNGVLMLDEEGKALTLPFPDSGQLVLGYLDANGNPHTQWPPAQQGPWPQLPAAITLALGSSNAVIVAPVTGPQQPRVIPYEPEPF